MRRYVLALALLLVATPVAAQDRLSDRQLRQRVTYAIARAENLIDEGRENLGHLVILLDELQARITADSIAGMDPTPDPEPDPEPDPTPDPEPDPTPDPTPDPGPTPTPSGLHPNEPAGMTVLYNNDGSHDQLFNLDNIDNQNGWYEGGSWERDAEVITDAANPTGSGRTVRMTHRAGTGGPAAKLNRFAQGGSTLGGTGYTGGGVSVQYLSLRVRIPAGQPGCDGVINGMKLFYLGMEPSAKIGSGANEFFLVVCVNEGWQIQLGGGGTSEDEFVNLSWPRSSPASWHLELLRTAESRVGGRDGTMTIWVNGREVRRWTGLAWGDPTRPGRLFDGIELYHTQHPPNAMHQWLQDELYVSGR